MQAASSAAFAARAGPDRSRRSRRRKSGAGAIVTGVGTVLADDPRLDCRVGTGPQPLRVVLDSHWRTPPAAALLRTPGAVLIVGTESAPERRMALSRLADTMIVDGEGGHVSLHAVLAELGRREVNEVHVEAGSMINTSLLQSGLVDEWLIFIAPRWLVSGLPALGAAAAESLPADPEWLITDTHAVGSDLRLRLRRSVSILSR